MDKMREEFEGWISHYIGESWLKHDPVREGEYFDNGTQAVWESWQASRAALRVKLPSSWYQDREGYILNREDDVKSCLDDAGVRYE